ncbi:hypothetical protein V2J09_003119 [Rumex salicifolius]
MAQLQKDVIFDYDSQGRIIVDRYAKALDILDGDNQDRWEFELHNMDGVPVHFARLLGDLRLEVRGSQTVKELTPMVNYNVYLDLKVEDGAVGFNHPVMFEFTDQHMISNPFPYRLQKGDNMVHIGRFMSSPGASPNVTIRLYDFATHVKKGIVVRRMRITTE